MKIVMRVPNPLGDAIMSTPAIHAIKQKFHHAHVTVLSKESVKAVFAGLPFYDDLISCDGKFLPLVKRLRSETFDLGVLFPNSFRSALQFFAGGIGRRIGYSRHGRGMLLTDALYPPMEMKGDQWGMKPVYMVDYYLAISIYMGCPVVSRHPALAITEEEGKEYRAFASLNGIFGNQKLAVVIPGAGFGSSKCWMPEYFAEVSDSLVESGFTVVLAPGHGEMDVAHCIRVLMKRNCILSEEVLGLGCLKVLIKNASLVIANDTGPRHIAVAFDTPVVVIMGPTDPRYTNGNLGKTAIIRKDLPCSPCHKKVCPLDHQCMKMITPDEVFRACLDLTRRKRVSIQ
jgi:heptosyltransferase-2